MSNAPICTSGCLRPISKISSGPNVIRRFAVALAARRPTKAAPKERTYNLNFRS